jgi:hypothetical protein
MNNVTPLYAIVWLILWFVISTSIQTNAVDIEIMKVWGEDNYKMLREIYQSDIYKQQQSEAILQLKAQLEQIKTTVSTWDKDETFADRE